ncbi:PROTEIN PHOSPHATASE PP2A REGULATORY SUBUNIT B [Salix koriyanagi]|uniref:Serine/threonine-protein phosphatase 2A 55 kDa regulatory subunit B n=1 Tax=Salix koriyanagi TaxID=2511006 RepID=A0A9Q0W1K6_9ROSI|nr:PROTEIN PHOSPHATASE PP2A REGULATORY SUBUNIT B [Salix koriyanagi]
MVQAKTCCSELSDYCPTVLIVQVVVRHRIWRTLCLLWFYVLEVVDIISSIEFDRTGDHLATGDRGGRVVLFERTYTRDHDGNRRDLEKMDFPITRHPEFRYKTEFQSHEPEFDYLKSLEIEEKINKIRWCQSANGALFLLSTNDKTIKFWKVHEKKVKKICDMNVDPAKAAGNGPVVGPSIPTSYKPYTANGGCLDKPLGLSNDFSFPPGGVPSLRLPVLTSNEMSLVPRCRRIYAHAHDYHINSISNNSDGETFISADDLRINLWNLEISNQSFNIVDVKPANMEDLTEVITSAEFHPTHCHMLAYSSSRGSIRLVDMRQSALCDSHSKLFEEQEVPGSRSFFTEIIASISDIKFAKDGRYILSRDYMTLKLWDINMDSGPVSTFQVHEYLRPKLCDLYENDSIFDKFECCLSGDGLRVATGSYSNLFRVFGCSSEGSTDATTLEASKNPMRRQVQTPSRPSRSLGTLSRGFRRGLLMLEEAKLTGAASCKGFAAFSPNTCGRNLHRLMLLLKYQGSRRKCNVKQMFLHAAVPQGFGPIGSLNPIWAKEVLG